MTGTLVAVTGQLTLPGNLTIQSGATLGASLACP